MAAYRKVAAGKLRHLCCHVAVSQNLQGALLQWCKMRCRLIKEHRESLENDIYAEGIEHVRRLLCSDFSKLCPMHTLYDSGEL